MFGIIGNLAKAVVQVAVIPVDIVADVVTLGGVTTDTDESYTSKRVKQAYESIEKACKND